MRVIRKDTKLEAWKISKDEFQDDEDWVKKAFSDGKIRWISFDGDKLQVMEKNGQLKRNLIPYTGEIGEYLVHNPSKDEYIIVNTFTFKEKYEALA